MTSYANQAINSSQLDCLLHRKHTKSLRHKTAQTVEEKTI